MANVEMVKCTECGEFKQKIRLKMRKTGRGWYHVDEKNRWWGSGCCPSCKRMKIDRLDKKRKSADLKDAVGPALKTRECRACGAMTYNWFLCTGCHASKSDGCWDMSSTYKVNL